MSTGRSWRDVKAQAHRLHPELADPARRLAAETELDAYIAGYHLKELRQSIGVTQAEIAHTLGVSQSRVSQIENGNLDVMEVDTLRAYAAALGGHLDITVSVGPHTVKIA